MKKLLLLACALFGFMACTQETIDEQSTIQTDASETIKVGFEDSETRIQLNEAQKTVWTKGDLASVFYRSDANQQWKYDGETGERVGNLKRVNAGVATRDIDRVVVVYPYNEDYYINPSTYNIEATLPAIQHYAAGSYGVGSNLMVSQSEFTQFSLKSVCGWLKLQLTGNGEVVKSIKFRANNGEQVAGLIYVNTETAEATLASEMGSSDDNNAGGNLVFDDMIITEVTLDCGEGVTLGAETTSFYISLPPQTFENGFTVVVECDDHKPMTLSTSNALTIERNTIQPMASVECDATPNIPYNEIWYTNGSTTEPTAPYKTNVFGANIVSNTYNAEKECWIIKFDDDVTTIGNYAFKGCSSLTSVIIPDSVTTIGLYAFYECDSLISVTIPDSVTTIGGDAFGSCSSLTSVTIPDSVTTIVGYAFWSCSSLTSVTIPDSVTTIENGAFSACSSLREFNGKYASEDGRCLIIDGTLNSFAPAGLTEYTIPNNITTIGVHAFLACENITSIIIPNSVTTIGDYAFSSCSSLTSIVIPDSVTTIGDDAFSGCSSLTSVTIPDSVTTIGISAFEYCRSLREFNGKYASEDGRCLIVDGVLNSFAPAGLTEYTIPDSVTTIGDNAFANCISLTSITIPDNVTTIGRYAFTYCRSLTSVTIPDSVTTIGDHAFWDCYSLTSVTIPDSVTTIGYDAFEDCRSLTSVYCKAVTPPTAVLDNGRWYAFDNNASDRKIYVPTESVAAYTSSEGWSEYADDIVGYNF